MNIQGAIPCGGDYAPLPPVEGAAACSATVLSEWSSRAVDASIAIL